MTGWRPASPATSTPSTCARARSRYSSIYRYKGLEAPAVVITDVVALDTPAECSLLYVGCTRALHRLVILADRRVEGQLRG